MYLSSTFFSIIVLLNFLIAVISQSYEDVMERQTIFAYQHRAELSLEYYQLLEVLIPLKEYRCLAISSDKEMSKIQE